VELPPLKKDAANRTVSTGSTVTRGMLRQRAVKIAVSCGRSAQTMANTYWKQAKEELQTNAASNRDRAAMNAPALERWENEGGVVPGTSDVQRFSPFLDLDRTRT
jgi:hypothetical protein